MLNNNINHIHSTCAFAERIVAYLYDEASAKERTEFETHLIKCSNCADELAEFGAVRSSVAEWRDEFLTLNAPIINIPELKQPRFVVNQAVSNDKRSWLADFRKLFSLSPMWKPATAAFASLVVCVGIALLVFLFSGKNELAVDNNQMIESPVSPANNLVNKENKILVLDTPNEAPVESPIAEIANSQPNNTNRVKRNSQNNSEAKISNSASHSKIIAPKQNILTVRKGANTNNEKMAVIKKRQAPKLSDLSEEEDKKSLRLADLFDEIGSK
jgi:hypothetical protein